MHALFDRQRDTGFCRLRREARRLGRYHHERKGDVGKERETQVTVRPDAGDRDERPDRDRDARMCQGEPGNVQALAEGGGED